MTNNNSFETAYWNTRQAAEYLGLSEADLRFMRHEGRGPEYVKFGTSKRSRVRYLIADVKAWPHKMTMAYNEARGVLADAQQ